MLTCKQVSHDLAADVLRSAGLQRRIAIRLHLLMCDNCRRFAEQLAQMGVALRQLSQTGDRRLTDEEVEQRILLRIQGAISRNPSPPAEE